MAAEGCLLRLTRLGGCPIIAGHCSTLVVSKDGYFASSLTEWGATAGRRLRFGGTDATGTVNQLLSTVIYEEPQLAKTLSNAGVLTLGDVIETSITQDGGEERRWITQRKLNGAGLNELGEALKHLEIPEGEILIKVGTCLIAKDNINGDVLEFLGWVDKLACIRRWTPCKRDDRCTAKTWYKLRPEDRSRGAGTDEHIDPEILLAPSLTVMMTSDRKVTGRNGKRIERQVIMLTDQGVMKFAEYQPTPPSLWKELAGDFELYPTGSTSTPTERGTKRQVRSEMSSNMVMGER